MTKPRKKPDLRSGLPAHGGKVGTSGGALAVEDRKNLDSTAPTREEGEPDVVRPGVGKNVPSGQTTKG